MCTDGVILAAFERGSVLRLVPDLKGDGGACAISDLYLRYCRAKASDDAARCDACQADRLHQVQRRIVVLPNVFLVQVVRAPGVPRVAVAVQEVLELPDFLRWVAWGLFIIVARI